MGDYRYVPPDEFTPESRVNWKTLGKITSWKQEEEGVVDKFTLNLETGHKLYIYVLSHATFRVRFNPNPNAPYVKSRSPATEVSRMKPCVSVCSKRLFQNGSSTGKHFYSKTIVDGPRRGHIVLLSMLTVIKIIFLCCLNPTVPFGSSINFWL